MGQFLQTVATIGAAIPSPAQPYFIAADAIGGALSGAAQQRADSSAASALTNKELGYADTLTNTRDWLGPVLAADRGAVSTLKSQVGGVANIGDLAKTLMGDDLEHAISASLGQRSSNLQAAEGIVSGVQGQALQASKDVGNPFSGLATGLSGLPWSRWFGTTTGVGGTPGGDVGAPSGSPSTGPGSGISRQPLWAPPASGG